jgi:hypothetical protein
MKIRIAVLMMCLGLVFAGDAAAQKGAVKFTSGYTNLNKNCRTLRGGDGQDDAYLCTGMGGYKIRIYSSASATHMVVEKAEPDVTIPIATVALSFNHAKSTVEWRMANGKPFALIMRVPTYGEPAEDAMGILGDVTGEELVVVGLAGYEETVSGSVNAKQANANVKARELADNAYKAAGQ